MSSEHSLKSGKSYIREKAGKVNGEVKIIIMAVGDGWIAHFLEELARLRF